MRFRRLQLPAFGKFTDLSLDFSPDFSKPKASSPADLHVIYGGNEAGKSTLLRAITALLYGIPARTSDNFLHPYADLRLAAEIESSDGTVLEIQRVKANKNALRDGAGNPLPEHALATSLGAVDESFFRTLFGMDHASLREGGERLLAEKNSLGQSLFSGSQANTAVTDAIQRLRDEADLLYTASGRKNLTLKDAVERYKELGRRIREAQVDPDQWEKAREAVETASKARETLDQKLSANQQAREWLIRCRDSAPQLRQLQNLKGQQNALPALPSLPIDFAEQIQNLSETETRLTRERDSLTRRLEQFLQGLLDPAPSSPWLAHESAIDQIQAEQARHDQSQDLAAKGRLDLARRLVEIQKQARDLELPEDLDALGTRRLAETTRLQITEQAQELIRQREDLAALEERIRQCDHQQTALRQRLDALPASEFPGSDDLALRTDSFANLAEKLPDRRRQHDLDRAAFEKELARLPLLGERGPEILQSAVPLVSTLREFQKRFESADQSEDSLRQQNHQSELEATRLRESRADLQRRSGLPDLSELPEARLTRDQRFSTLLQLWEKGQNPTAAQAGDYPPLVRAADEIADRLRSGAEALAGLAELDHQIERFQNVVELQQTMLRTGESERATLLHEWSALWKPYGVEPLSPAEMIEWRERWQSLVANGEALAANAAGLEQDEATHRTLVTDLGTALSATGSFARLRQELRTRIDEAKTEDGERRSLAKQVTETTLSRESLSGAHAELTAKTTLLTTAWSAALKRLQLPAEASPATVAQLLARQQTLFAELDRYGQIAEDVADHVRFITEYEVRLGTLTKSLALGAASSVEQVRTLVKTLAKFRKERIEQDRIASEIHQIRLELDQQTGLVETLARTTADLLKTSKLKDRAALPALVSSWQDSRKLVEKISDLETILLAPARGEDLASFRNRVLAENHETLDSDLAILTRAHDDLLKEREVAEEQRRSCQDSLSRFETTSDLAAQLHQDSALVAADIERQARRFIRLESAITFLEGRIAAYREVSQGPLMHRSGELFQEMTDGRFTRLETGWDDSGDPYLLARSAAGPSLSLDALSEGTRDQLFLALRLAALEQHLESHEPLPLILDDLFITFDDRRSAALLKVLARFAERTQILLFTHHRHLLEVADEALSKNGFHRHELSVC
jgi:uncharacterized protein YhaN